MIVASSPKNLMYLFQEFLCSNTDRFGTFDYIFEAKIASTVNF